jgi:hypothetical protein
MTDMKYRYSVQYVNKEGNYQEDDVFGTESEAEEHRHKVLARENREVRIVDLEKNEDNPY